MPTEKLFVGDINSVTLIPQTKTKRWITAVFTWASVKELNNIKELFCQSGSHCRSVSVFESGKPAKGCHCCWFSLEKHYRVVPHSILIFLDFLQDEPFFL